MPQPASQGFSAILVYAQHRLVSFVCKCQLQVEREVVGLGKFETFMKDCLERDAPCCCEHALAGLFGFGFLSLSIKCIPELEVHLF